MHTTNSSHCRAKLLLVALLIASCFNGWSAPDNMTLNVSVSGTNKTLVLRRYSIRSADFKFFLWSSTGGYVQTNAPEVTTYRGSISNEPNFIVCGSLRGNNLYAIATEGKNYSWSIGPVDVSAQIGGLTNTGWSSPGVVVNTNSHTQSHLPAGVTNLSWNFIKPTAIKQAELGYDVSWNYYKAKGNNIQTVCDETEDGLNRYNNFMARDGAVDILYTIMVVRTDSELYVPASGGAHLNLVYNEWKSGASTGNPLLSTQRWDIVATYGTDSGLFGTGGYAWEDNIGKDEASVCANALFHENCHNWNGNHYFYGNDTMNGSYPSHGAINVQRVLNKRITEITQSNLDDVVSYPEPLHPYTTIDLASTLTNTFVDVDVLTNDWDSKGLGIGISRFTATSDKGGSVTQVGNKLRYTPPLNYVGKDIVAYWITNTAGLENRDLIHIEISNNDLAARWEFEGTNGTSVTDISSHTHTGTLAGTTLVTNAPSGPSGRAIDLGGAGTMICDNTALLPVAATDYPFETAANNYFDPMDRSFTLAFWFQPTSLSGASFLFKKSNPASLGYEVTADASGFHFSVIEWTPSMSTITLNSGTPLALSTWYHVVCQIDRGTNRLRMWVNGQPVATTVNLTPGAFIFEGRNALIMGDTNARLFDDVRIYTRALSNAEVFALYDAGVPPAGTPSPANDSYNIAFNAQLSWSTDSVSNKHDVFFGTDPVTLASATTNSPLYKGRVTGTNFNPGALGAFNTYYWRVDVVPPTGPVIQGPVWHFTTADSPLTANLLVHLTFDNADLSGATVEDIALAADNFNNTSALTNQAALIGQAFYFNGSNSYATSLSSDIIPTSAGGTISCWMKTTNASSGNYIVSIEGAWVLQYQGASGGVLAFLDGSSTGNPTANASLNNGAWHHIVAANDGTTTRLYVDGTLRNTYAEAIYNLNSLTRQTAIGSRYDGGGNLFTGNVDDVGIWSRNLSAGEVNQIYTNGLAGKTLELAPVLIANTSFESAEGFTGYVSPNFAALGTKFDLFTNEWGTLANDVQIWNRSDIPPNGVQCLKVGDLDGQCRLRLAGTNHGVRQVTFDYASYSGTSACDFSLSYSNAITGGWIQAWTTHITGQVPNWTTKPWPTVSVLINVVGDVDLLFTKTGAKGVLVDNFSVTAKSDNAPVFANNPTLVTNATVGAAFTNTLAGRASDPDAFDAITFSKVSGPSWLNVAAGGALTGTPLIGNVGTNNFVVRVSDAWGGTNDSALTITVTNMAPPNAPLIAPSVVGTSLQIQIASQSGYNYVVQAATNLVAPISWSNLSTNAGTGGTMNLSAPIITSTPQRFFRVWAY